LFIGTQFSILYGGVEDTKLSTNKQHSLSLQKDSTCSARPVSSLEYGPPSNEEQGG